MADRFKFDEMLKRLQLARVEMPLAIAENGKEYFRLNFKKQQSPDGVPWAPRKKDTKSTFGKPILVHTGNLKSAMQNTVISYDWTKIVWGVRDLEVPYAKYLNYGTSKMVARPFITTDGREIKGRIRGVIKRTFDKVMLNK